MRNKELETIDNEKTREALNWLEEKCYVESTQTEKFEECCATIKNCILKTQEQKKYLKWKDLDFGYGRTKVLKVRMNDTIYKIFYRFFDNTDEVQLLSEDEKSVYFSFVGKFKDNVQLFNDLHLEVVE